MQSMKEEPRVVFNRVTWMCDVSVIENQLNRAEFGGYRWFTFKNH